MELQHLKLDESYQLEEQELNKSINNFENDLVSEKFEETSNKNEQMTNNIPSGVSIESASYMENNNLVDNDNLYASENSVDESAPKLFSEDQNYQDDTSENKRSK